MNTVTIRRSRIQIDTARGPTRSYSPAAARCIAWLTERDDVLAALLPLLQDSDPYLASALARLVADRGDPGPLARALVGAADQITAEGEERVRLSTPAGVSGASESQVSGTDGQSATMSGNLEILGGEDLAALDGGE